MRGGGRSKVDNLRGDMVVPSPQFLAILLVELLWHTRPCFHNLAKIINNNKRNKNNKPTICQHASSHGRGQVTVTAASLSVDKLCGTVCHMICSLQTSRRTRSRTNWKHFCLTLTCICAFRLYKCHYYYY